MQIYIHYTIESRLVCMCIKNKDVTQEKDTVMFSLYLPLNSDIRDLIG